MLRCSRTLAAAFVLLSALPAFAIRIGDTTIDVPAFTVVQVNDLFASLGIAPQANVRLRFSNVANEDRFYSYASIVRDGNGDAVFIFGTSPNA